MVIPQEFFCFSFLVPVMEESKFKCYHIKKNVYYLKTKYYETNIPFMIMNVLTEQVVNRFTLFIFAKMGHVKALS